MPEATLEINSREEFLGLLREGIADIVKNNPEIIASAMTRSDETTRAALAGAGIIVSGDAGAARDIMSAYRAAQDDGRVLRGFGARVRQGLPSRRYTDAVTGKTRHTYLFGETEKMAAAWFRAFFAADKRDVQTGKTVRELGDDLNKAVRAPATPMTSEAGTGGGFLVPTVVAAEIMEEFNERFVLQGLVEVFTSATPLRIPRRISQISVSRGGASTDISEADMASTLGEVTLSPERVSVLSYVDPLLALAASVGPVRWVVSQFAEAMAKDFQRVIIAGNPALREPRGILSLPTSGQQYYDMAQTATFDGTSNQTIRDSVRKLYYKVHQRHRESSRAVFIGNNDVVQKLASVNDMNQQPFQEASGGNPTRFLGKTLVESLALATVGSASTLLFGDMSQYAWLESPDGLRIEQTTVGGQAWVSDTIGIKMVQSVDGAPVIPPAFGQLPSFGV